MYFEAEQRGKKYQIEVHEGRDVWTISLQQVGGEKEIHRIPKTAYRRMDNGINFLFEDSSYMLDVVGEGLEYTVYTRGSFRTMRVLNDESLLHESLKTGGDMVGGSQLNAGMPGKIVDVLVKVGDSVKAGQTILIMEAMKMENEMRASVDTKIKEIKVKKGQSVETGQPLIIYDRT
jgi:biotin carboxyl carrier protein